jgi:hypothetical protein
MTCPYCKANNSEFIEIMTGAARKRPDKMPAELRERVKGTILSYVHR